VFWLVNFNFFAPSALPPKPFQNTEVAKDLSTGPNGLGYPCRITPSPNPCPVADFSSRGHSPTNSIPRLHKNPGVTPQKEGVSWLQRPDAIRMTRIYSLEMLQETGLRQRGKTPGVERPEHPTVSPLPRIAPEALSHPWRRKDAA